MPNAAITLTEEEQLKLEEILLDQDEKEALEFLRRAIKMKIEQQKKGHCQPQF